MNKKNPAEDNQSQAPMNRRRFVTAIGNSAVGITSLGGLTVVYKFLSPNVLLEIPSRFQIGTLQTISPNSVIFDPEHRVFVFRDIKGYLFAVSAICTHLGCTGNWKAEGTPEHPEGVITCPCHGSVFTKTGRVLSGPAPRDLDRFRLNLEDGKLFVDTEEIVSEEEMILKV